MMVSPAVSAGNVVSDSRIQDGRVQLILSNTTPEVVITLERVEVPAALAYKRGTARPVSVRTVPASGIVGERTVIDLGSVEEVFNGGGPASETVATLKSTTTAGMTLCLNRHTPVTVLMRLGRASIKLTRAVPTTFCHGRTEDQQQAPLG
ncbi:hypothetical protein [Stenotrophomonas oahuensis]|uniref:AMIN domain-containing protein n=1 Tax=Stenotrophomonas oahuensis TaxID=3003271 RepID=A0ABY9YV69_9GAMM|nr:hypothetical protein [Stenotrophomonas sp. A5586]WNH54807.1 hypothetical protein PDM29_20905 [Stenotrophomonas sp. A5586]